MIERELKEGSLKLLPLDQGGSRKPSFYLYSNKDKTRGPATQILIELLRTFDTLPLDAPFAAPEQPDTEFTDGVFRTRRLQPALRGIWPRHAVVCVHGLGSSTLDWEMQIPALAAHYG